MPSGRGCSLLPRCQLSHCMAHSGPVPGWKRGCERDEIVCVYVGGGGEEGRGVLVAPVSTYHQYSIVPTTDFMTLNSFCFCFARPKSAGEERKMRR